MDSSREVAAFYDKTARDWADAWYENESMLPFLRGFLEALVPAPRVLDLGCGAGYETMRLAALGADAIGVDISEKSLAIARARNPQLAFYAMDMRSLDASLGRFDGVIAIASLVHLYPGDLPAVFASVFARLRSGGRFWVVFSEGDGYDEKRSVKTIDAVRYDRHFIRHRAQTLREAALHAGFPEATEIPLAGGDLAAGWRCLAFRRPEA